MKITSSSVGTFAVPVPAQQVSMAKGADGRILIATNTSNMIYTGWITADAQKTSNTYTSTGAKTAGAPFAITPSDGRMAILYRDTGNQLMCLREKADHTGWESPAWVAQALLAADPVVGRNADGRLEIYLLGTDGALYHVKTSSTGADGWKPAEKFGGGGVRDLTVASTADGRQAFFHTNSAAQVWLIQQSAPNGGWSTFSNPVNGVTGPLAVARAKNSTLIGRSPPRRLPGLRAAERRRNLERPGPAAVRPGRSQRLPLRPAGTAARTDPGPAAVHPLRCRTAMDPGRTRHRHRLLDRPGAHPQGRGRKGRLPGRRPGRHQPHRRHLLLHRPAIRHLHLHRLTTAGCDLPEQISSAAPAPSQA